MAARLIYIKTVSLLPRHEEAETLKKELTGELIEYRDCKLMAKELSTHTDGFDRYVRPPQEGYVNYAYERFHEGRSFCRRISMLPVAHSASCRRRWTALR